MTPFARPHAALPAARPDAVAHLVPPEVTRMPAAPIRRVAEVAIALAALALASPLLLAAAALVAATSPGGAIYTQTRVGRAGRPFRIYKLRSMAADSEAQTGARWSLGAGDPRVTPVGRFLRRSHLDELPQLWNVVRGDMAFVGPRPERPEILAGLEDHVPGLADRLAVRPGVTGLAQIQQSADTSVACFRDKLEYDRLYIAQASVPLDLRIVLGTVLYLGGLSYETVRVLTGLPRPGTLPADSLEITRALPPAVEAS